MRLTQHTDFALRLLMYLAVAPERPVRTREVAERLGVSEHHLNKIVQRLGDEGLVEAQRGRGGGLRLGQAPETIRVGDVVRLTERDFGLVECTREGGDHCVIEPICALRGVLNRALEAFLQELDDVVLSELVTNRRELMTQLNIPHRAEDQAV